MVISISRWNFRSKSLKMSVLNILWLAEEPAVLSLSGAKGLELRI